MKKQALQFWRSRAPRERLVLGAGGALAVLVLGYAYAWLPMAREAAQLRENLPELRAQARQVQAGVAEVNRLKARAKPAAAQQDLVALLDARAKQRGLRERIDSIVPLDANRVRVTASSVPFDVWLGWLGELQAGYGVRVESARIDLGGEPGVVAVEAVFTAGS
jgi:general secretion pathway protein M